MSRKFLFLLLAIAAITTIIYLYWNYYRPARLRGVQVFAWIKNPASHPGLVIAAGARCGSAPFIFPTTGVIGFIWGDMFQLGHPHEGIDIFAGTDIDVTKVIAAYPGYLTRLPEWKSSVIVRVPNDPLQPDRQIWVYYTHMADAKGNSFISSEFPPGTYEKQIEAGTLIGYQGDYSGDPNNPVGVHLHVSIVKDNNGHFMNELDINNTYDPSPYFGLALNAQQNRDKIPVCEGSGQ